MGPTYSSSVTTPDTVRKIKSEVREREDDTTSHLTYIIDNDDNTSGYRSISTDIIDVDERLQKLVGEMYSWQMGPEEEDSMEMIETEARLMLETLTSSGIRSRSASVTSTAEEESRCSSLGILKETHIAKLELESELSSGRPVTKIHDRDAITNKEFRRPKIPPKPPVLSFVQNQVGTAERNKSYLIATKNPQFEPEPTTTSKPDATLPPADEKMQTSKEKRSLKFSKLWRRAEEGSKPGLEIKASKIPLSSKPSGVHQPDNGSKSLISKTFRNFTLKRSGGINSGRQSGIEQNNTTPPRDKRLGTSIVLLSPNDAEVVEKLEPKNQFSSEPVQTQVEYRRDQSRTKIVSGREHLVPIIKNPRTKFLESERKNLTPAGGNYSSRKLDFQDSIKNSSKKITASNKVTLV